MSQQTEDVVEGVEDGYIWRKVDIPIWGGVMIIVTTDDGLVLFPIRTLALALGLAPQMQGDRLRSSRVFRKLITQYRVPTGGGRQKMWYLDSRAVGLWLGTIQDQYLRPEVADGIVAYQEALMVEADKLLRRTLGLPTPAEPPALMVTQRFQHVERFALKLAAQIGELQERVSDLEANDDEEGRP